VVGVTIGLFVMRVYWVKIYIVIEREK